MFACYTLIMVDCRLSRILTMKAMGSVMRIVLSFVTILTIGCHCSLLVAQEPNTTADDHEGVYRPDPRMDHSELILVPADEIKSGFTYNYYSPVLKRRVWGFATEDHSFEYAFGEGTIVPTNRLDLRLSAEAQERILEERVPSLKQDIEGLGRSPAVQLNAAGEWKLLSYTTSARIFDLLTSERWEWHGKRRLGVVNMYGNSWQIVDGEYEPLIMDRVVCW